MKHLLAKRAGAAAVALALAAGAFAPPAAAAQPQRAAGAAAVADTLREVPILGGLLSAIFGGEETAQSETDAAATPAPTQAPTPEPTPAVTPAPVEGTPVWPEEWMRGAAAQGYVYPAGSADAQTPTAAGPLWGNVQLTEDVTLRAACREETNLGDLAADAMSQAVAASAAYQGGEYAGLPLVAILNGGLLTGSLQAGTALTAENAAAVLTDDAIALVTVTPQKLHYILNAGLSGIAPDSETYGSFLQVSGLRFTYEVTNGDAHVKELWLAGLSGQQGQDLNDTESRLALALPQSLLERCGLTDADGYENALADSQLTLCGAVAALAQNCDAETLAALTARQGTVERILPVTAQSYTAVLAVGAENAGQAVRCLLDGEETAGPVDDAGNLYLYGLTPGSHTVTLPGAEEQPARYVSGITYIGVENGTAVTVTPPADCVTTREDAAALLAQNEARAAATPAPTEAPAAPATAGDTAAPTPTAAISDPSQGLLLGVTPAPTLEPTPSPVPTPSPTPDPAAQARKAQLEKAAQHLPLYIGLGVLALCALLAVVLLIQRRRAEKRRRRRRARQNTRAGRNTHDRK